MNLKKAFVTGIAAVGLMASIAAPVATAQDDNTGNNTSTAHVNVTAGGVFDVFFSAADFNLSAVSLTSEDYVGNATGSLNINYEDTKSFRPDFEVDMSASNFMLATNNSIQIPATGFTIETTYNVQQDFCGGPGAIACQSVIDYGDIGYRLNDGQATGQAASTNWTVNQSLDLPRGVQFGYDGIGTRFSTGKVDVALVVPSNTQSGEYTSTMTLSVTLTTP